MTKREMALGRTQQNTAACNSWNGEVVSLGVHPDGKVEFFINGAGVFSMPFEEMKGVFIKSEGRGVFCNSIMTDSKAYRICSLSMDEFEYLTKNKLFLVVVDNDVFRVNRNVDSGVPIVEEVQGIFNALDSGRYEDVKGKTTVSRCFQFKEV